MPFKDIEERRAYQRDATRRYRKRHLDKVRATNRNYAKRLRAESPNRARASKWRDAGINVEQASLLLAQHDGHCDICGTDKHDGKGWQVDHDHTTGHLRGVLCFKCNTALGKLGDSVEGLMRAVRYLEQANHKNQSQKDAI